MHHIPRLIEKKRDGHKLTEAEIRFLVRGFCEEEVHEYQMAAFAMAVYFRGMDLDETMWLTMAMMESGEKLDLSDFRKAGKAVVDKHSTGGVGDKVSLVLAPLVASCGLIVPMVSGRGLGITGGTLDKLESIPNFSIEISISRLRNILGSVGCAIVSQTNDMVPADRKLYALRDVTGTVPSIPLIVSSIMSKKLIEDLDSLVLDVKWGNGAFMRTVEEARTLATQMVEVGRRMGKRVVSYLTDMNQPLGRSAGNSVEVAEAIDTLQGRGPEDLRELTFTLAAEMLCLGGTANSLSSARSIIEEKIRSHEALRKLEAMIEAQGGDSSVCRGTCLPKAQFVEPILARAEGYIEAIDCYKVGQAAVALGAGRKNIGSPIEHSVGFSGLKKIGERIRREEPIAVMHSVSRECSDHARSLLLEAYGTSSMSPRPPRLIVERIG